MNTDPKLGAKQHQSSNFARQGMKHLLEMKGTSQTNSAPRVEVGGRLEGSQNLKALLKRSRGLPPLLGVGADIQDSYSSNVPDSDSGSGDISDPSSDSETLSCFRGSLSPGANFTSAQRSDFSATKVKTLQMRPSITVMLNDTLQCVIRLDGSEARQVASLAERYHLSRSEAAKLDKLVQLAIRGGRIDLCKTHGLE